MRLGENSHHMVEIEGPESGITVSLLKDILNQAKLYIRPLQKDITEEDMKEYLPLVRQLLCSVLPPSLPLFLPPFLFPHWCLAVSATLIVCILHGVNYRLKTFIYFRRVGLNPPKFAKPVTVCFRFPS